MKHTDELASLPGLCHFRLRKNIAGLGTRLQISYSYNSCNMREATHLQFQLGLDERWHVRALLVGVVQQVLQRALYAVEEAVQDNVVEVFDVLPPDVRVSLGSEQLPVLLHQSVDLLTVGLHLGVAATHVG